MEKTNNPVAVEERLSLLLKTFKTELTNLYNDFDNKQMHGAANRVLSRIKYYEQIEWLEREEIPIKELLQVVEDGKAKNKRKFPPKEINDYVKSKVEETFKCNNGNLNKEDFRLGMYTMWYHMDKKGQAALPISDGWIKIENKKDLPPENTIVWGFNERWIDEDFNEEGVRECHYCDGDWNTAKWDNDQDDYYNENTWVDNNHKYKGVAPTHWMQLPLPPNKLKSQPINTISDAGKLQAAKDVVNNSVLHGNGGETGIWLRSQISFLEQIEGKVKKVTDYAGGLSIQFENGNKYGLKISKLSQVTLD